jgi:hypothetical protein
MSTVRVNFGGMWIRVKTMLVVLLGLLLGMASLADGQSLPPTPLWPSGTVVRANDGPSVYKIDEGRKRGIQGPQCQAMAARENVVIVFTPPYGCVDGRLTGSANQRFEPWTDVIPVSKQPEVKAIKIYTSRCGLTSLMSVCILSAYVRYQRARA